MVMRIAVGGGVGLGKKVCVVMGYGLWVIHHTLACVTSYTHHQKDKPTVRIELTTFCLQNRCTTTVLCRQADPKEKLRIEQDAI